MSDFASRELAAHGFQKKERLQFERERDGLFQGIEFIKRRNSFTATAYWSVAISPLGHDGAFHFSRRFGRFIDGRDQWFSTETELEKGMDFISKIFHSQVLSFFERFGSIAKILNGIDAGELEPGEAFGADAGWQLFLTGFSQMYVGDNEAAKNAFRQFMDLDLGPLADLDWVQERKRVVVQALQELGQA